MHLQLALPLIPPSDKLDCGGLVSNLSSSSSCGGEKVAQRVLSGDWTRDDWPKRVSISAYLTVWSRYCHSVTEMTIRALVNRLPDWV